MPYQLLRLTSPGQHSRTTMVEPADTRQLEELSKNVVRVQFSQDLLPHELDQLADWLSHRPQVELRIYGGMSTAELQTCLEKFRFVQHLAIDLLELESWDALDLVSPQLRSLSLGQTRSSALSLKVLKRFAGLENLTLDGHKKDFSAVAGLVNLRSLCLRRITLPDLTPLLSLKKLEELRISLGGTRDVGLLDRIGKLTSLELSWIRGLADVSSISRIVSLERLHLESLKHVETLPSLAKLRKLTHVSIENLGAANLTAVVAAPALEKLTVLQMPQLEADDFRCLQQHPTLKELHVALAKGQRSTPKDRQVRELIPFAKLTWTPG